MELSIGDREKRAKAYHTKNCFWCRNYDGNHKKQFNDPGYCEKKGVQVRDDACCRDFCLRDPTGLEKMFS